MEPQVTFTQTSLIEAPIRTAIDCREYKLNHRKKENIMSNNIVDSSYKCSPYEEMRPKNEPKFLSRIRKFEKDMGFVTPLRWINIISITVLHVVSVVWFSYRIYNGNCPKWQTVLFGCLMGQVAGFGVTGGVHRYWSHRSYKANLPLQIILLMCYSTAGQNDIYQWVRDHRVHHKFSETSADPHDANRGFFFAHVGWLMMKKHPDVRREGAKIDMSDITSDPLIQFHTKYFILFKIALCSVLPSLVPALAWGEDWSNSVLSQALVRYMLSLNFTWSVNSFAHLWGNKPYDKHIMPSENWGVSIVAMGEGWHNYHHTFPWDYKAAELAYSLNLTTLLLHFFAKIGWAYDMKQASPFLIQAVARNRGERPQSNQKL